MTIKVDDAKQRAANAERAKHALAATLAAARKKTNVSLPPITMWLRFLEERDRGQA
jgi:hypothetical protein